MEQSPKRICIRAPLQTTINDLNDYVLRETFCHMNVEELVAMADVCSNFRRIARKEFSSRYEGLYLRANIPRKLQIQDEKNGRDVGGRKMNFADGKFRHLYVARSFWIPVLRNFGNLMTYLDNKDLYFESHPPPLNAIAKYCSESLLGIDLYKAKWTNKMISDWQPLLSRLLEFTLNFCEFESGADASRLLSFCVELEWLTITRFSLFFTAGRMSFDFPVTLPRLVALDLHSSYLTATDAGCLIELNPQLEIIKLPSCTFDYDVIGTFVPNVKNLTLRWGQTHSFDWKIFKQLKCLRIIGENRIPVALTPLLKAVVAAALPLERLYLSDFELTHECITQIAELKHLKTLWLRDSLDNLSSSDILTIVRNLPKLQKLLLSLENPSISEDPIIRELECVYQWSNDDDEWW